MSVGYSPRTDELLEMLPLLTEREFADLAIACADQAGLPLADQLRLSAALQAARDRADDRRDARLADGERP